MTPFGINPGTIAALMGKLGNRVSQAESKLPVVDRMRKLGGGRQLSPLDFQDNPGMLPPLGLPPYKNVSAVQQ